ERARDEARPRCAGGVGGERELGRRAVGDRGGLAEAVVDRADHGARGAAGEIEGPDGTGVRPHDLLAAVAIGVRQGDADVGRGGGWPIELDRRGIEREAGAAAVPADLASVDAYEIEEAVAIEIDEVDVIEGEGAGAPRVEDLAGGREGAVAAAEVDLHPCVG